MRKSTNVSWKLAEDHTTERELQQKRQESQVKVEFKNEHSAFAEQNTVNLQHLLENVPGVIIEYESRIDGTHHYRYISKAIENVFGVKASHIFKITQYIHPDDLDKLNRVLDRSAKNLEPFYIESRLILPGRGVIWRSMSCSFSHISDDGSRVFSGIMLDISERKKEDERKMFTKINFHLFVVSL